MEEYLLSATLYGLAAIIALLITFSYMISVMVKPTKTTIGLLMHFIVCVVLLSIISLELYSVALDTAKPNFLGRNTRASFHIMAGLFLLYALWEDFLSAAKHIRIKIKDRKR